MLPGREGEPRCCRVPTVVRMGVSRVADGLELRVPMPRGPASRRLKEVAVAALK